MNRTNRKTQIKVMIKEPQKKPYFAEVDGSLQYMRKIVGGELEGYPLATDLTLLCDSNAPYGDKPYNASLMGLPICGTFVLVGVSAGELTSLPVSEDDVQKAFPSLFCIPDGGSNAVGEL